MLPRSSSARIKDYTVLHQFAPTLRKPAFQLIEMGMDGQGGNSDLFWMEYPYPFLEFYYETFPLVHVADHTVTGAATPGASPAAAAGLTENDSPMLGLASTSVVYEYLQPLRSEKRAGRQINVFTCKVLCRVRGVVQGVGGVGMDRLCGSTCTLYGKTTGPVFKHVRTMAKRGCAAHQAGDRGGAQPEFIEASAFEVGRLAYGYEF